MNLSLRPWTLNDAPVFLDMMSRVDLTCESESLRPHNLDGANRILEREISWMQSTNSIYCAIVIDDEVVGLVQVVRQYGISSHVGDVGCMIAKEATRHGIGTQAIRQVVSMAFNQGNFERLTAEIYSANKASQRMVEKLGFKLEATLRQKVMKDNVFYDSLIYGLLPDEIL